MSTKADRSACLWPLSGASADHQAQELLFADRIRYGFETLSGGSAGYALAQNLFGENDAGAAALFPFSQYHMLSLDCAEHGSVIYIVSSGRWITA